MFNLKCVHNELAGVLSVLLLLSWVRIFYFSAGLSMEAAQLLAGKVKKGRSKGGATAEESTNGDAAKVEAQPVKLYLNFKRYMYDPKKRMMQT